MEYIIKCPEKHGPIGRMAKVEVERGKVVSATPSFMWAVGEGLHVVLSYCASRKIRWARLKPAQAGQMEMAL